MKNYTVKGLYNSYDRKHKERDALDYYATPIEEVTNILSGSTRSLKANQFILRVIEDYKID